MATGFGGQVRLVLLAACGVAGLAACGESFVSSTGATGAAGGGGIPSTGGGGAASMGGSGGGQGGGPVCEDGDKVSCYSGPAANRGIGVCTPGMQECKDGAWGPCEGSVLPAGEICDGQDNDCKGDVDEGCPCTMGEECFPFPPPAMPGNGACQHGVVVCQNGQFDKCLGVIGPETETCNGQDDNCDGTIDNVEGAGNSCPTGLPGACGVGQKQCDGDGLACVQTVMASDEVCDGVDNNCDGTEDNLVQESCTKSLGGGESCSGLTTCAGNSEVCGRKTFFSEDFHDNGAGWTLGPEWGIGPAMASPMSPSGNPDPAMDHSPGANNGVAGAVIGDNFMGDALPSYLTSPQINTSGFSTLYLSYWRWLNANDGTETPHTVEITTNNGAFWTPIWTNNDKPVYDSEWVFMSHKISMFAGQNIRVRFSFARLIAGQAVSGWNIDDLELSSCPPPAP